MYSYQDLEVSTNNAAEAIMEEYVKLTSSDNFDFVVTKEAALVSGTLRGMLSTSSES